MPNTHNSVWIGAIEDSIQQSRTKTPAVERYAVVELIAFRGMSVLALKQIAPVADTVSIVPVIYTM